MTAFSAVPGVEECVDQLIAGGLKHVVLSPGSRNAPLSLALFNRKDQIQTYLIADERSAAYVALGMAWQLKEAVAIVCTSGTAVLNYYPAIAEAFYRHIPLWVITADRPAEWIDQGDGQTIRQVNVYANHIKSSLSLPEYTVENASSFLEGIASALKLSLQAPQGPIHINFPIREPLYVLKKEHPTASVLPVSAPAIKQADEKLLREVELQFLSASKTLILCGQMHRRAEIEDALNVLGLKESVFVLSETTSNLVLPHGSDTIDRLIDGFNQEDAAHFSPEILITLGDAVVSKKVKAWLRKSNIRYHLHLGATQSKADTYQHLKRKADVDPLSVLKHLVNIHVPASSYRSEWLALRQKKETLHQSFVEQAPWSDLKAYATFLPTVPSHTLLHLGNSTPIRYAQLFGSQSEVIYDSNRGTSGIDGSLSTAVGESMHHDGITCMITGDIAFYYDSNALWNQHISNNLRIILINNGGGNIFRVIDGPESDAEMEYLFEAHQDMNAKAICQQFNIGYITACDEKELSAACTSFWVKADRPQLLEIFTDHKVSPNTLKSYFQHLKK